MTWTYEGWLAMLKRTDPQPKKEEALRVSTLQLNPPIPVWTKKGTGVAHFLIDYGFYEHHLLWIVAMDKGGEVWGFENPDIRFTANQTYGRTKDAAPSVQRPDMSHEEFTKLYGGE